MIPLHPREFHASLPLDLLKRLPRRWHYWARECQRPPRGDWRLWLVCAGRGFGKTRTGAEWVNETARRDRHARIALVAASLPEARAVMVEGESGILAHANPKQRPKYEPSLRRLIWPNGAQAFLYSAAEPDSLRGPQHSHAWCDELGKWPVSRAEAAWDNLQLGLRLGARPRIVATTTPRPVPLVRRLAAEIAAGRAQFSHGTSYANAANLPSPFLAAMHRDLGGSNLGRQELGGELLLEVEGALWTRALIERCRGDAPEGFARTVIGVDPPASANGDECGIVVCALDGDGLAHVLADCSLPRPSPEQWARAVADAAARWNADRVIAEANQGGAMVESVLRAADVNLPVRLVHASHGKAARAEPVAALYEAGRVRHAGLFAALEDQLCGLLTGGGYEGPRTGGTRSPDRADALVWALSELMLGRRNDPRVMRL